MAILAQAPLSLAQRRQSTPCVPRIRGGSTHLRVACSSSYSALDERSRRSSAQPSDAAPLAQPSRGRVVVAGGGVAGLATTLALRRVGFDAVCYDGGRPAADHYIGLQLWPSALKALREIDSTLAAAVTNQGDVIDTMFLRRPDGRLLEEANTTELEPSVCIRSHELLRLLREALPAHAVVQHHALLSFQFSNSTQQSAHNVLAVLSQRYTGERVGVPADFLVGADGLRSQVRAQLLGGVTEEIQDAGSTVWRGIVDSKHVPDGLCLPGSTVCSHSSEGRTLTITSLGGGLHYGSLFWVLSLPEQVPGSSIATTDHKQPASAEHRALHWLAHKPQLPLGSAEAMPLVSQRILTSFGDFAAVPHLLAATPAGAIVERRLFHRADESSTANASATRGCVTLVGDAAQMALPSLGLGACLSLQGAAELAKAVDALAPGAGGAAVAAALRRYERAQRQQVAVAVEAALKEAARVTGAASARLPTSGPAFQGWLLGNAQRGASKGAR